MSKEDPLIFITRPTDRSENLASLLKREGFEIEYLPTIKIQNRSPVAEELSALSRFSTGEFEWVVFTSVSGVKGFEAALRENGFSATIPSRTRTASIGRRTGGELLGVFGERSEIVPQEKDSEGLLAAFTEIDLSAARMLLVGPTDPRPVLKDGLLPRAVEVVSLAVYETIPLSVDLEALAEGTEGERDVVVTLYSPSSIKALSAAVERTKVDPLKKARIVTVGPVTSAAVSEAGYEVWRQAEEPGDEGVLEAICSA